MEAVVFEDSPLARYLEGEGEGDGEKVWPPSREQTAPSTPPSLSFAPRGRPTVQTKFRSKLPPPLRLTIPSNTAAAAFHNTCSKALNSRLGRADNTKFLERFRYIIVASQLLSEHSYLGQPPPEPEDEISSGAAAPPISAISLTGAAVTAAMAFLLAWTVHWARGGRSKSSTAGRAAIVIIVVASLATLGYAYVRRKWLQYLRQQTITETSNFVLKAQNLDNATSGTVTLIQEVELVSRGYRIGTPLPPITRLEDRGQTRRCLRLRRSLYRCFVELIPRYNQAVSILIPLAEEQDLEKYYDIYDLSELDLMESRQPLVESEIDDNESLRGLKILVARLHIIRKVFLCCLLALEADGGKPDFLRWSTALDEIHALALVSGDAEERLRQILGEEESFPVPSTPKIPLTPSRERWRVQLRKLNSLSTGIRGLQAKLHVLRDESEKTLNESVDLSDLGPHLMLQYESIGVDLRALMREWEESKATLASTIEKNERRISSMSIMSGMLSPTISLGGLTSVEEGSPADALKALTGEDQKRSSTELSNSEAEEVFEAIAIPKQRSTLTRDERIARMKEDRERRESMRDKAEANTHMLRELESVINLRPRNRTAPAAAERITSI